MGDETVVVIGGGVGPMAGVALHAKIIENTLTDGTDQSHLTVHHYSCSASIPDRTDFLLGSASSGGAREPLAAGDPALAMARVFLMASRALDGRPAVGGVPCNTFHAPAIFGRFLSALDEAGAGIRVIDMLAESVQLLRARLGLPAGGNGSGEAIGVLSTTGTRRSGVYDALLAEAGFRALHVPESGQAALHAAIYDPEWGIKATPSPSARAVEAVESFASGLVDAGAAAVMLACTELPLVMGGLSLRGRPLVDPVLALARALIREAAPEKLKPL